MRALVFSLVLVAQSAVATEVVYLKAGPPAKVKPTPAQPEMSIVGIYEGEKGTVIMVIRACGRDFSFGIPKSRLNDDAVFESILDYLRAECTK
jgi:hypothetical protein